MYYTSRSGRASMMPNISTFINLSFSKLKWSNDLKILQTTNRQRRRQQCIMRFLKKILLQKI